MKLEEYVALSTEERRAFLATFCHPVIVDRIIRDERHGAPKEDDIFQWREQGLGGRHYALLRAVGIL